MTVAVPKGHVEFGPALYKFTLHYYVIVRGHSRPWTHRVVDTAGLGQIGSWAQQADSKRLKSS